MTPPRSLIDAHSRRQLAEALGDSPVNAIFIDALLNTDGMAVVAGSASRPISTLVATPHNPGEPMAFGDDVDLIWSQLQKMEAWTCVEVERSVVAPLADMIRRALRCDVQSIEDVFLELRTPAPVLSKANVRLLSPADEEMYVRCAPHYLDDPEAARRHIRKGPIAAAVHDDRVVSAVEAVQRTSTYANLGAETLPAYRGSGYCTSAAALVAREAQSMGLTPLWSASVDNPASLRVAEKLGFVEVDRRVYLVPQRPRPAV